MVTEEDIAGAICYILSTAKTRQYVITIHGVIKVLGEEIHHGAIRRVLNKYGFKYVKVSNSDTRKYVVDVEHAKPICEKIRWRRKKGLFFNPPFF
jgi:transposase